MDLAGMGLSDKQLHGRILIGRVVVACVVSCSLGEQAERAGPGRRREDESPKGQDAALRAAWFTPAVPQGAHSFNADARNLHSKTRQAPVAALA